MTAFSETCCYIWLLLLVFRLRLKIFCTFCLQNSSFYLLNSRTFPLDISCIISSFHFKMKSLMKAQLLEDSRETLNFSFIFIFFLFDFQIEMRTHETDSIGPEAVPFRDKCCVRKKTLQWEACLWTNNHLFIVGAVNPQGMQLPGASSLVFGSSHSSG